MKAKTIGDIGYMSKRKRIKHVLRRLFRLDNNPKVTIVVNNMEVIYYTPKEAKRIIKNIKKYPSLLPRVEKSTGGPVSYSVEDAIEWVKSRIRW